MDRVERFDANAEVLEQAAHRIFSADHSRRLFYHLALLELATEVAPEVYAEAIQRALKRALEATPQ
jgi:hypothetical protein